MQGMLYCLHRYVCLYHITFSYCVFLFLHAYSLTHADAADADADADGDTAVEDAAMMTRDNARYVVLLASICLFVLVIQDE